MWHYLALTRLWERLIAQRRAFMGEAAEPIEPHGMHQADSATDEFDHEFALSQLSAGRDTIEEVDAAIRRIFDGTYGVCELTGKRIPAARLKAVPWTRYCRDAEAGLEEAGNIPRPQPVRAKPSKRSTRR